MAASRSPFWQAMSLAGELGYLIAIPITVFALLGRALDRWWGATPMFLLIGIAFAIAISGIAVARKLRIIARL